MAGLKVTVVISICCLASQAVAYKIARGESYVYGTCELAPNKNFDGRRVTGSVTFRQSVEPGDLAGDTQIVVDLNGLDPDGGKLHGFHVHEFGDLSDGCESTGSHYNPFGKDHGAPSALERHVGDLGNVAINSHGNVMATITDRQIDLVGKYSVIGRAIVVHEGEDDLGLEDNEDSRTTGNAGSRMACCVIGISPGPAK